MSVQRLTAGPQRFGVTQVKSQVAGKAGTTRVSLTTDTVQRGVRRTGPAPPPVGTRFSGRPGTHYSGLPNVTLIPIRRNVKRAAPSRTQQVQPQRTVAQQRQPQRTIVQPQRTAAPTAAPRPILKKAAPETKRSQPEPKQLSDEDLAAVAYDEDAPTTPRRATHSLTLSPGPIASAATAKQAQVTRL